MDDSVKNSLKAAKLLDYFMSMSPSHQKEYLTWIQEAKKRQTKEKRIAKMIEMLEAKQ